MLASAGRLLARGPLLPAGLLEATRMRDANAAEPSRAVVQSVEFHPDGQVLLTAGLDKRLRFFQVCLLPACPCLNSSGHSFKEAGCAATAGLPVCAPNQWND